MTKLTLIRCVLGLMLLSVACGDDDDNKGGTSGSGAGSGASASGGAGGAGGRSSSAGAGGASGRGNAAGGGAGSAANSGSAEEGDLCDNTQDCASGLACALAGALEDSSSGMTLAITVCARHCNGVSDCDSAEMCMTVDRSPENALCWSTTTEIFKACGPAETSVCGGDLDCLPVIEEKEDGSLNVGGYCVQYCDLTGMIANAPKCPSSLNCVDALGDPEIGVCAKAAARGEACGVDVGTVCGDADFCIDDGTTSKCYQDCTANKTCDGGKTCMPLNDDMEEFYCE